ncbi:hypothetical protein PpBr36_04855 [Pyricularia pennisetigena]|uniref:hypothetical protein n=1 Tax=Pyricularia pennisetigena TaxID=1578925 RepID=UPI0011521170|nr:hypothetical protein PpBr36_04855 [Pyricularia pennisetigena]TLS26589.1 hypothetical protein PpBr36_04855 [Pyricularia pennisetigena]
MASDSVPTEPLPKYFCFRGCHPADRVLFLCPYHWSQTCPKNLKTCLFCVYHENEPAPLSPAAPTPVKSFRLDDLDEASQSQTSPDRIVGIVPSWLRDGVATTMRAPPTPPLAVLDPAVVLTVEKCPGGRIYQSASKTYFVSEGDEDGEDVTSDDSSLSTWPDSSFDDDNMEMSSFVTAPSEYVSDGFDHDESGDDDLLHMRTVLARERAHLLKLGFCSERLHDLYYAAEFILVRLYGQWDEDLCRGFYLLNEQIDTEILRLQKQAGQV